MQLYELATNKAVLITVMSGLLLFGLWCELKAPVKINERIYLAAAAYQDVGCNLNPEHPMLAKELQSLALTNEYKQGLREIYPINCAEFYANGSPVYWRFKELYYKLFTPPINAVDEWYEARGVYFLRMVTAALLFLAIVLYFKNPVHAFIVFNLFYLTKLFYIAELDGWLALFTIIAFYSFATGKNRFGSLLAYVAIPLIKFNGFAISFLLYLIDPKKNPLKILVVLLAWLVFFNLTFVQYGFEFYSAQVTRFDAFFQYQYPIYFPLLFFWLLTVFGVKNEIRNN